MSIQRAKYIKRFSSQIYIRRHQSRQFLWERSRRNHLSKHDERITLVSNYKEVLENLQFLYVIWKLRSDLQCVQQIYKWKNQRSGEQSLCFTFVRCGPCQMRSAIGLKIVCSKRKKKVSTMINSIGIIFNILYIIALSGEPV